MHLKELRDEDIRGITERLLRQNEAEEVIQARERAGIDAVELQNVLGAETTRPTMLLPRGVVVGQSKMSLSWIWFTHMPLLTDSTRGSTSDPALQNTFQELHDSEYLLFFHCYR